MLGMLGRLLGCAPPRSEAYVAAAAAFAPDEVAAIERQFHARAAAAHAGGLDGAALAAWCGLAGAPAVLLDGLLAAVAGCGAEGDPGDGAPRGGGRGPPGVLVTLKDMVVSKALAERTDDEAAAQFAFRVLDPAGAGAVSREHLASVMEALLRLSLPEGADAAAPAESAAAIAAGALAMAPSPSSAPAATLDLAAFRAWAARAPAAKALLTRLLANLPRVDAGGAAPPRALLLRPEWVWLLAPGLAPDLRREWRLLFSSAKHGASYSTFLSRLGDAAPTLLLVRDGGGRVFGGIAHAAWRKSGAFYGDYANCVFTLLPQACVYPASGINANLQWCGVNFGELPNGVGFGGQQGNFGLWLDASLETGHSRPNATYASPSLSTEQSFAVDAVEAWLLRPPDEEEEAAAAAAGARGRGGAGQSILTKVAREDQALLELAGVAANNRAAAGHEPLEEG
ncbi:MAG: TLD-domain-containing protein [Monoraphidium minutum]|nr:MAG: TLD-domain-containing protein [Monoraphidium minutum]